MKPRQPNPWGLTAREAEVMEAWCEHGCAKLVAHALGWSIKTVEALSTSAGKRMGGRVRLAKCLAWDRWQRGAGEAEAVLVQPHLQGVPADAPLTEPPPQVGEIWHILRAGAATCATVKIAEMTKATVVVFPHDGGATERLVLRQVEFVECVRPNRAA